MTVPRLGARLRVALAGMPEGIYREYGPLMREAVGEIERLQTNVLRLCAALHTIAGTSKFKHPPVDEMIDIATVALNEAGRDIVQSILKRDRM